ncbi:uncharacterized protein EV154DRAFT_506550 [Mucor mucedo]|uniref:uncharacterized protein n=1 Tax=Mucor mucedo TaxID=29922 RepID=UPI00221FC9B1|nr:uncharacterized protein EV154DRAFT_506550 [Mucor mucedo]KAI7891990.1 hypothetical protein EV154DRAFT_506550 [Mucor mucedo]
MDFIKKFYFIKISKSSSSKKSILDHQRSISLSNTNSDESLLSDYSDDEQAPVLTYRQRSILKKSRRKTQLQKKKSLDTLYFQQKQNDDPLVHLAIKVQEKNDHDVKIDPSNRKSLLSNNYQVSQKTKLKLNSNNDYSTLYSPFTQRPEIIEDDYIPLPTVTRNYIDPPPDSIIDSLPYPFRTRRPVKHKIQQYENALPSPIPSTERLISNPKRHSIGNGQMDRLLSSNRKNHKTPHTNDFWLITRRNSISIETHISKKMCH